MSDSILKRLANGDQSAAEDCLKTYGGLVWSLARRMLWNSDDAEDAVQEIFVDVWKNAGRFDESLASETTFIVMIARRRLIDRIRFVERRISPDSLDDMIIEPQDSTEPDQQTVIEAREAYGVLRELRQEQRQVLELALVHGHSHQEIADLTSMPLGTVKTHARRGLLQARELLGVGRSAKEASV